MEIEHLSLSDSAESALKVLNSNGAVVIDNILDQKDLEEIKADLNPYLELASVGKNEFSGYRTKRIGALMARSPKCRELALHPFVNSVCEQYLSPYSQGYQLHFTQAIDLAPGEGHQDLHRDRGVWGPYINRSIETQFSTIWAISDFSKDNGATRIVPGSHTWDRDRKPESREISSAEMSAGSVLFYNGSVLHGGGTNSTESANRIAVLLHYTLSWLRQEENQYLSCPPEVAKDLSPELRSLMGYTQGGPVLGFYSTPGAPGEGVELAAPENLFK